MFNAKLYHHDGHDGGHCGHHAENAGMCGHMHGGEPAHSPEEALALLKYMIDHNKHHADELHELAHSLPGEAAELVHSAVGNMDMCNAKLEKALAAITAQDGKEA